MIHRLVATARCGLWLAALLALAQAAAAQLPVVHIGSVLDGPVHSDVLQSYVDEIHALTEGEMDVRFEPRHQVAGDWTLAGARAALEALLADPEIDLVLALGPITSQLLCCIEELPKPTIATIIIDPQLQDMPLAAGGGSGRHNLTYVARPSTFEQDLDDFLSVVRFRHVATLGNGPLVTAIPGLEARVAEVFARRGLDDSFVPVEFSAAEVLERLPAEADAVYLTPLFQLPAEEWERLLEGLLERRLPTFTYLGQSEVERGVLAGSTLESFFPRLARRVALNVQRILLGEEAASIPVYFPVRRQLQLNMATARRIGVYPTWDVLVEAVLIDWEDESLRRRVDLYTAVEQAVEENLDLLVQSWRVKTAALDVDLARSALRPRLDLGALGVVIDDERAGLAFSTQAERTLSASLSLSQVLYSEPLAANLAVQGRLDTSRRADYDALRLDIAQAAATAYLDVLRAKTLERIQRDNLRVTRYNLDLARVRREVGTAREAEVVRWESQIASDRQAVVNARVTRELAQLALNRLLNQPLDEGFLTAEVDLEDPRLIMSEERLEVFTRNPRSFALVRDFMVGDGLARSPELASLDALIAAQERGLTAARRAFWAPAVGLSADLERRLAEGGAGADGTAAAPLPPGLGLEALPETTWSLALSASLPLYAGGERAAAAVQAEAELTELRLARRAAAERIEQRIRAALLTANGSYQGIELSAAAAAAARRNLELVTDAYARGALSILELLDAQNAALVADQVAADAEFDFLADLMEVQRSVNRFDFFTSVQERSAWLDRLGAFLLESGVALQEE